MSDITKSVIAVLCLSASFAGWGMEWLSPSPGAGGARPFRPRCELKHIGPAPAAAVAVSPLRSNGLRKAAGVVAQDWFEKAKAKLMKRGEVHTNVVDVLVAFDRSAMAWLAENGYGSRDEFAEICLRKMNWVLENSGLLDEFSFQLAGTAEVDVDVPESYHAVAGYYDSDGNYEEEGYTDLSRVLDDATGDTTAGKRSPKWTALRAERELACADVVSLLVASETDGTVGLAYSLDRTSVVTPEYFSDHAYSVVCIERVMKDCTQVHEIGHLMGAGHSDQMDSDYYMGSDGVSLLGPQLFPYSAGMYFNEADGEGAASDERDWLWRYTVMGYNYPGPSWGLDIYGDPIFAAGEPCFSSPDLFSENGVAKGDALHDNARTLRETYAFVANYRVRKAAVRVVAPEGGGTATGQGVYSPGQTVKLAAKPTSGHVFAGWYSAYDEATGEFSEPFDRGTADYRTASQQFAAGAESETVYARFVTPAVDAAALSVNAGDVATGADGSISLRLGPWVESLSTPKLSVRGLPSGLKYDAKTLQITGIAKKPGVYTVTVQATNASVKKATTATTATFRVIVPNFVSRMLPNLRSETDAYGTVWCGVNFSTNRVDCTPLAGWTVKASGLPSGLKFDAKKGVVGGVPTKAGSFTVTFTASKKGEKNQIATITLNVTALPSWAVGTFNGSVGKDGEVAGLVTMTVAANGKIGGKLLEGGKTWTLSAPSFDGAEDLEPLGQLDTLEPLDSLDNRSVFYASVIAKAGKEIVTNKIAVAAEAMSAATAGSSNQSYRGVVKTFEPSNSQTFEPSNSQTFNPSTFQPFNLQLSAWQTLWKTEPWKTTAKPFAKAPTLDVRVHGGTDGAAQPGVATLKFASSGAVTAKGVFITGYNDKKKKDITYSARCSSVLIPVTESGVPTTGRYELFLYFPPKAGKFGGCASVVHVKWNGSSFELE